MLCSNKDNLNWLNLNLFELTIRSISKDRLTPRYPTLLRLLISSNSSF
jgi:hypothetical protein